MIQEKEKETKKKRGPHGKERKGWVTKRRVREAQMERGERDGYTQKKVKRKRERESEEYTHSRKKRLP